mmetsp:Transcript_34732/g.110425  ORF Transcript_34732/g.110425 Transcript_34732/m.110425 type:complete len:544 (-) Transcript_34732:725-2356(-)
MRMYSPCAHWPLRASMHAMPRQAARSHERLCPHVAPDSSATKARVPLPPAHPSRSAGLGKRHGGPARWRAWGCARGPQDCHCGRSCISCTTCVARAACASLGALSGCHLSMSFLFSSRCSLGLRPSSRPHSRAAKARTASAGSTSPLRARFLSCSWSCCSFFSRFIEGPQRQQLDLASTSKFSRGRVLSTSPSPSMFMVHRSPQLLLPRQMPVRPLICGCDGMLRTQMTEPRLSTSRWNLRLHWRCAAAPESAGPRPTSAAGSAGALSTSASAASRRSCPSGAASASPLGANPEPRGVAAAASALAFISASLVRCAAALRSAASSSLALRAATLSSAASSFNRLSSSSFAFRAAALSSASSCFAFFSTSFLAARSASFSSFAFSFACCASSFCRLRYAASHCACSSLAFRSASFKPSNCRLSVSFCSCFALWSASLLARRSASLMAFSAARCAARLCDTTFFLAPAQTLPSVEASTSASDAASPENPNAVGAWRTASSKSVNNSANASMPVQVLRPIPTWTPSSTSYACNNSLNGTSNEERTD